MATQLNIKNFDRNKLANQTVYASMMADQYSGYQQNNSYIPSQFRQKLSPNYKYSEFSRTRELRNNRSCTEFQLNKHYLAYKKQAAKPIEPIEEFPRSVKVLHERTDDDRKWATLKNIENKYSKPTYVYPTLGLTHKKSNPYLSRSKIDDFLKIKLLGNGKFGDVYLVKHRKTGFLAALKTIRKADVISSNPDENRKAISQLISEIKIQSFMNHPNLIKLYDFFHDEQCVYLLLQLACDGHLLDLLTVNRTLSEESTAIVVKQIVAGVQYMHERDVIHRDLKLQNIVLSHGMAKICDFGWSVYCPTDFRSTFCGTPLYLSPEILIGHHYNKKIDTWAIGTIAYQLFTSQNPFNITKKSELSKIVTEDFQMQKGSSQLRSFITFILRKDPAKRPDTALIKKHPFFVKYKTLQTSEQLCRNKNTPKNNRSYVH